MTAFKYQLSAAAFKKYFPKNSAFFWNIWINNALSYATSSFCTAQKYPHSTIRFI